MFNNFLTKIVTFTGQNVGKYGTANQAIDENIIQSMSFECGQLRQQTRTQYM